MLPVMSNLSSAKYVRLTSFTKDGRRKHTPVWIAELDDGSVATTTDDDSWKVKRIRTTSDVELAVSDGRGVVEQGSDLISGNARIVDSADSEYRQIESAFITKYGLKYRLFRLIRRIRGKKACGITMALNKQPGRPPSKKSDA